MQIFIDQSIKLEQTNKDTVVAFANHLSASILIRAQDKQEMQKIFRDIGKPYIFRYRLFAILIFLLIKEYLDTIQSIIIDPEYRGWEHLIKNYLLQEIRKVRPGFDARSINFASIGKKAQAHTIAYLTAKKKIQPTFVVSLKQIMKFIVK